MKKIIFLLILAFASSLWTLSSALCIARAPQAMQQPTETLSGFLLLAGTPCDDSDPETPCADCLTLAFEANGTLYYLTSDDSSMETQLNEIEAQVYSKKTATITGILYQQGSYNYINVQNISLNNDPLPSLCDEWNIAQISNASGPEEVIHTIKANLGADTLIGPNTYVKLMEGGRYNGALREGNYSEIYYIPAGSSHEYLLYKFNANVGERLSNLWYGGHYEWCPNGYNATVISVSNDYPKEFTIEVEYVFTDSDGEHIEPWLIDWTEGVGLSDGPAGFHCPGPDCACSCGQVLLCAYKNGDQVYVSALGEKYGCVYNYDPFNSISLVQSSDAQCSKIIRNGQILILRGDRTYTLTGQEIIVL